MTLLTATFIRDLRSGLRHPARVASAPLFFVMTCALFPLALGADPVVVKLSAPGLIAVAALFAAMLPLDIFFREDRRDGTLDLLLTSPDVLALYVAGKTAAHWLKLGLPLLVMTPLMVLMLGLPPAMIGPAVAALLPSTLLLNLMGALGAALAAGSRQGSLLLTFLIVPFYIPVLIFTAGAIDLAANGISQWTSPVLFLWAMLALVLPLSPLAAAAILKGLNE